MDIKTLLSVKSISKQELEIIFRTSNSSDELFDAFRLAISGRIEDADFYKTLLWNKALSTDEIIMFTEKICKEMKSLCYPLYYAVGQIFCSISFYGIHLEKAFTYYLKAAAVNPSSTEPYSAILKMYNRELDIPKKEEIILAVINGIELVENKSSLCFEFSSFFKNIDDKEKERFYNRLGEMYQKNGM